MKVLCTYCSATKSNDDALVPAITRYRSDRIAELDRKSGERGLNFMILSGKFGLIGRDHPLPDYDHLLQCDEVDELSSRVAAVLCNAGVKRMEYYTAAPELVAQVRPYLAVIEAACERASVALRVVILPGDPA